MKIVQLVELALMNAQLKLFLKATFIRSTRKFALIVLPVPMYVLLKQYILHNLS